MAYESHYPQHAADLLRVRAELTPGRDALLDVATGTTYTYGELNARANRTANWLRGLGVGKGDRVSILAQNSVHTIDLLYGLGKIGAIFAPLNWRLTARELVYIAGDCAPRVVVCGPEFTGLLADVCQEVDIPVVVSIEGADIDGALVYEECVATASPDEPQLPPLTGEDIYCILYTSGTTGRPKGAMIPHRQVLWNCINTVISWGWARVIFRR